MNTLKLAKPANSDTARANVHFYRTGAYAAFAMGKRTERRTFTEAKEWCIAQGATTLEYDGFTIALVKEEGP
jgi:hypothetical protein